MKLTILQTSDYALAVLKNSSDFTVHSVYQKAVNLKTKDLLLTLQPRGSVLSPISLITDCTVTELASLPLAAGEKLSLSWNLTHVSCQDLFLSPVDLIPKNHLEILAEKIRQAITLAENTAFPAHLRGIELIFNQPDLASESLYLNAIQNYLRQFYQALPDPVQATEILCHMIGLGIGLTPCGDDFLCGFLAGIQMYGSSSCARALRERLKSAICSHLDRTNEISAAFLRCAACAQFSAPVHLLQDPDVTADRIYQSFSAVGHSSGIDTLCGIYTALYPINTVFP